MSLCPQFLLDRLAKLETMIIAYEDAIIAINSNGGIQSYKLDTGQDSQLVTKQDIEWMQKNYNSALNQWTVLNCRCNGGGSLNLRMTQ